MAANDELPRGWLIAGQDVTPFTLAPAVAGVAHVLDSLDVEAIVTIALAGPTAMQVQVNGVIVGNVYVQAAIGSQGSFNLARNTTGPMGSAMAVTLLNNTGIDTTITASGHDI